MAIADYDILYNIILIIEQISLKFECLHLLALHASTPNLLHWYLQCVSFEVPIGYKTPTIYTYGHYILSDGCYFLPYRYNLVCVAHYFLPYRYDSLSYQYNILWDACIIYSVIFRIYSVMLSICCVMGIICSV